MTAPPPPPPTPPAGLGRSVAAVRAPWSAEHVTGAGRRPVRQCRPRRPSEWSAPGTAAPVAGDRGSVSVSSQCKPCSGVRTSTRSSRGSCAIRGVSIGGKWEWSAADGPGEAVTISRRPTTGGYLQVSPDRLCAENEVAPATTGSQSWCCSKRPRISECTVTLWNLVLILNDCERGFIEQNDFLFECTANGNLIAWLLLGKSKSSSWHVGTRVLIYHHDGRLS